MRVILADHLFDGRHRALELIEVLQFACEGRHIVLIEPEFGADSSPHAFRWLAERGPSEREDLRLALESSLQQETTRDREMRTLCVGAEHLPTDAHTTHSTLAAAHALLRRPLKILVENKHNDGAFVRRMLPPSWRDRLNRFEHSSWAEFEHGGGLGTLVTAIERVPEHLAPRTVAVFDSDAPRPDAPSRHSMRALHACMARTIEHAQLRRRASENYAPPTTILAWSAQRHPDQGGRKQRAEAFGRLTQAQRHHYAMRKGLGPDTLPDGSLPELFAGLNEADRDTLMSGFGDIQDIFARDDLFDEAALARDDAHGERETLRSLIFRNL